MLFIIVIFILAVIITLAILAFVFKVKAVIRSDDGYIELVISFLKLIKVRRKYIVKRESPVFLALYTETKKGLKPVITLADVINKIRQGEATNITLIEILRVITQFLKERPREGAFYYSYKKSKYKVRVALVIGLGDAFSTAMLCGLFNAASEAVCARYYTNKRKIEIKAVPEFSKLLFSIKADCIITIAPADIIIGYAIYKKNKRR